MFHRLRFFLYPSPLAAACLGVCVAFGLWFSGCAWKGPHFQKPLDGAQPLGRVSVMAFNAQNLFDAAHDEGREDYPFLPRKLKRTDPEIQKFCRAQPKFRQNECFRLDWTDAVVKQKLRAIGSAIKQVYGQGPDILILEEIENSKILRRLKSQELKNSGYQTLVWKAGSDARGIAVGLLSRFPLAAPAILHPGPEGSRGILEVPLLLPDNSILTVFGVHFPSQMNVTARRAEALLILQHLLSALPADAKWIVGGDWNITASEDRSQGFIGKQMRELGQVSHLIGCDFCSGTHFYRGEWDFLDILVFSKNLTVDANSIRTPSLAPGQAEKNGRPLAFHPKKLEGISDHFPIYAELIIESKTSKPPDHDRRSDP